MSTVFIAVQCFQCSTMQVKQQKKSGNKWICVVCNEKQSVRKVFAQGSVARDVRKFVQSFNMSRQFVDERRADETLVPSPEDASNLPPSDQMKRTDWTEYIDPEDNRDLRVKDEPEDMFEEMIVRELSKPLFKKPKLIADSSSFGREKDSKPVFSKRNSNQLIRSQEKELRRFWPTAVNFSFKESDDYRVLDDEDIFSADKEPSKLLPTMSKGASKWRTNGAQEHKHDSRTAKGTSKWSEFITADDENEEVIADEVARRCKPRTTQGASKWDNYIIEDDDELQLRRGREFADGTFQLDDDGVFEVTLHEQKVEEDVHPDFL